MWSSFSLGWLLPTVELRKLNSRLRRSAHNDLALALHEMLAEGTAAEGSQAGKAKAATGATLPIEALKTALMEMQDNKEDYDICINIEALGRPVPTAPAEEEVGISPVPAAVAPVVAEPAKVVRSESDLYKA